MGIGPIELGHGSLKGLGIFQIVIGSAVVGEHRDADHQQAKQQAKTFYQLTFHGTPLGAAAHHPVSEQKKKQPEAGSSRHHCRQST
jgi:hypothetical protein